MSVGTLLKETTTVTAANSAATVFGLPSVGAVGIQITGTMTGTTISFEATVDNANWVALTTATVEEAALNTRSDPTVSPPAAPKAKLVVAA